MIKNNIGKLIVFFFTHLILTVPFGTGLMRADKQFLETKFYTLLFHGPISWQLFDDSNFRDGWIIIIILNSLFWTAIYFGILFLIQLMKNRGNK